MLTPPIEQARAYHELWHTQQQPKSDDRCAFSFNLSAVVDMPYLVDHINKSQEENVVDAVVAYQINQLKWAKTVFEK